MIEMLKKIARSNAVKYIISFLAVTLFFFILTELSTRLYFSIKNKKAYYMLYGTISNEKLDAILGRGKRPTFSKPSGNPLITNRKDIDLKKDYITSVGMRYRKVAYSKPRDVYRIVALGGSTTYGQDASDNETYPYYLEELLNDSQKNGAKKFEVINIGVCGATIWDHIKIMKSDLIHLNPDMVIMYEGWNEVKYTLKWTKLQSIPDRIVLWLMGRSLFFAALREKIALMMHNNVNSAWDRLRRDPSDDVAVMDNACFRDFENDLTQLILYLQKNGIQPLLIKFPYRLGHTRATLYEINLSAHLWRPAIENIFAILKKVSAETNTPLIDCASIFNRMNKNDLFMDVMHPTPKGNKELAKIVCDYIRNTGSAKE